MRVTAIQTQSERKRQDRSVRCAEKRRCRAGMPRGRGLIRPHSSVPATADAARGEKHLFDGQVQASFLASRRPLGECRLTFDGSCELRLKRGSTKADIANLSNHAWGTAFDINARWNPRKSVPAMMGDRGCVRELVAIANANGFYWGGHFSTVDGMHFEVASESL